MDVAVSGAAGPRPRAMAAKNHAAIRIVEYFIDAVAAGCSETKLDGDSSAPTPTIKSVAAVRRKLDSYRIHTDIGGFS